MVNYNGSQFGFEVQSKTYDDSCFDAWASADMI